MYVSPIDAGGQGSSMVAATQWIQATLLGSAATAVAVIAVASIGFLMLVGRVDVRRGLTVVLGCFILFGAPAIAAALRALGDAAGVSAAAGPSPAVAAAPPSATLPPPRNAPYDPYAGAAVVRD